MSKVVEDSTDEKLPPVPRRPNNIYNNSSQAITGYGGYGAHGGPGMGSMYGNPYQSMMYSNPGLAYGNNGMGSTFNSGNSPTGIEDATANAFQSVGSVVQVFSSVSMMLESMLFATQNSVRALASVADQFHHLRLHLSSSGVGLLRTIRYYIRKFMVLFRVKQETQPDQQTLLEDVFETSSSPGVSENGNWAVVLFYAIVFATPVIIWQLLRKVMSQQGTRSSWYKGVGEHFLAEVKHTYNAEQNDELSINSGDVIRIAPKHKQPNVRGWILASDGEKQGIVPANYIKIVGKNRVNKPKDMNITSGNTTAPAARVEEFETTS